MPSALLRACGYPGGCPELVTAGYCQAHARAAAQHRGSATQRGYDAWWRVFRVMVRNRMIALGIAPVCGATLPGGPPMGASRCRAAGILTGSPLHLHHDPPLQPEERHDRRAACDPTRVGWLCASCHSAETRTQQREGRV